MWNKLVSTKVMEADLPQEVCAFHGVRSGR